MKQRLKVIFNDNQISAKIDSMPDSEYLNSVSETIRDMDKRGVLKLFMSPEATDRVTK
jgi:hypothetical protein